MKNSKVKKPVIKGAAKVPTIMQLEALECGAACLCMVMAYYGKWVPLEQARKDCGVSRDGSKAKNVVIAARNYGFKAKGFRCEVEGLKKSISYPCIIHWNFNHFVVLEGFKGNYAYINDPGRGEVKVSMDEFDRAFTGICLAIEPGEDFEPSGKKKSVLEYVREHLKGAGEAMVFLIITSVLGYLFGLLNPVFTKFFMDRLLTGENSGLLMPFVFLMSVLAISQIIVAFIQAIYQMKINGKIAAVGNSSFMWNVLKKPMEFFSQRLSGDILQRQGTNASIASTLVNTFTPLFLNSVMMVFYLVVMLRYSAILTLVGIAAISVNLILSRIIANKRESIMRIQVRDKGKLSAATVSGIQIERVSWRTPGSYIPACESDSCDTWRISHYQW